MAGRGEPATGTVKAAPAAAGFAAAIVVVAGAVACSGGRSSFCDGAKELQSAGGLTADLGVGTDPAEVQAAFSRNRDALAAMRDAAPEEIGEDARRAADAYDQIVVVIERNGGDLARASDEISALLDDQATQDALSRVAQFAREECDL